MKQYYITSENIAKLASDPTDCYLAPTDIVHTLKHDLYLGGLGSKIRRADQNIVDTIDAIKQIQQSANPDKR